jgi:DNA mismatch endonuclease (patch repair protein)
MLCGMVDVFSPEKRSEVMRAVQSRDTTPEIAVRKCAHGMGLRFRLHSARLPGSPDIVFPSRRLAVFVHGCFWHGHDCPRGARKPATNADYWRAKIARNVARDLKNEHELRFLGWDQLVVWECETRDADRLRRVIARIARRKTRKR